MVVHSIMVIILIMDIMKSNNGVAPFKLLDDDVKLNLDSLLSLALNKDFLPEDDAGYKIKLFSNYDKIAIFDNKKLNTPNVDFKSISSFYESWLEKPNPYRRYVPDDVIENIVAYSKDFFQNIDPSLYSGLAEIVDSISRKMKNVEITNLIFLY